MTKDHPGEQWKTVKFDIEFTNEFRLEVSNFGRIRSFNKTSNGNLVNGSTINGYRIIRMRFFRPRDKKVQTRLDNLQQQVFKLKKKLRSQIQNSESKTLISETTLILTTLKKSLSKKFNADLKGRTIYYHSLFHRLVAEYFLKAPTSGQTVVGHLDHEKLNNRANNLKWMTPEENYLHQKGSPYVIKEMKERRLRRKENSRATKLTVTKVMLLKKLINQGKPMKQLVKQFKVTDTKIFRIKRGENWGDIEAAK